MIGHRLGGVRDADYPRFRAAILPGKPLGVAAVVEALVVLDYGLGDGFHDVDALDEGVAVYGVFLDPVRDKFRRSGWGGCQPEFDSDVQFSPSASSARFPEGLVGDA